MRHEIKDISKQIEDAISLYVDFIAPAPVIKKDLRDIEGNSEWLQQTLLELLVNECIHAINEREHEKTHGK
jgi:hypothetical protein